MSEKMQLIVGLGNVGTEYTATRHNAGFWFVEELARRYGGQFRDEKKFHGQTCRISIDGHACRLLMPSTLMNRSGLSVASLAGYFQLNSENILVAHDELDLEPGSLKLKAGGGHAGHNGLRDIINALGSQQFMRLRIGVGHPGRREQVVNYVLSNPSRDERQLIDEAIARAADEMKLIVAGDWQKAMNRLH